ncbi:glycosyltransferase family 4 protein [Opitutaceae bacterium]
MTSPRHVVILWDYYQHYHYARLSALVQEGGTQGWKVTGLAAGHGGAARDSHRTRIQTDGPVPTFLGGNDSDLYSSATADALLGTLDQLQPDVVIIPGYGSPVARAAVRWCRRNHRGAVMIIESQERDAPRRWWREWAKRRLVRSADTVFCGGITHAAYAEKLGMDRTAIYHGYSAVDNVFWWTAAERARAQERMTSGPYFVAVGRFVPKKNFSGLVEAFARFKRDAVHRDWHLVLVGDGPERENIEAAILAHGLKQEIHLPGYANEEVTARWLGHAAALVLPSSHAEQWGLVVNEAMAAGLPVVVSTACGCVEDLVEDDVTGYRVRAGDTAELATALNRIARDETDRRRLGAAARSRVETYSLEHFAQQAIRASIHALDRARTR